MLKPVSFNINAYLIRAVVIENHQRWGGLLWEAFNQSKLPWRGPVDEAGRANFLAHGCCRRGKRAAVGGVEEWALGMSVRWASPTARALDRVYLEHLDQPTQDTGRRLVSEPLPEVTS